MRDEPVLTIVPPPAFLTDPALVAILTALPEARVVGGAVRDTLAARPVADIDLATPRHPPDIMDALQNAGIRAEPTGIDHGTITAIVGGRGFEVTTLRRDVETDGRHARVAFTTDWQADAGRRDFTINALSMTRAGAVFDYFGGVGDLRAGVVRFVGDPATRIAEDYLRILRFFRFFARYAAGDPDTAALIAIRTGVPGIMRLSAERIWAELMRILQAPDPRRAIALMNETGVLAAIVPEGCDPSRLARLVEIDGPIDPLLRLAALLTGDPMVFAVRLKLSTAERDRLIALLAGPVPHPGMHDAALRRMLADTAACLLIDRTWLAGGEEPEWGSLRGRLTALPRPVFPLGGRDAVALGVPPGPRVGEILRQVRGWWLDRGCTDDAEACRTHLARLLLPQDNASSGSGGEAENAHLASNEPRAKFCKAR